MRLIWRVLVCLAALAALAATPGAAAQPASGTITGTITGDGGNRLEGVAVTVQNQLTGARHTATTNAQGVATPVGAQNPLPVINTAAAAASDGSGAVATGGSAQTLFGGAVPINGFLVQNNSAGDKRMSPQPSCT